VIRVVINGEEQSLERPLTVAEYVASLPVNRRWVAVARNGEVVPRHRWHEVLIEEGDVVEVVRMVGGGAPRDGTMGVESRGPDQPTGGDRV